MSIQAFKKVFPDNEACYRLLEQTKWPGGIPCSACGGKNVRRDGASCKCADCASEFSILAGTPFEKKRRQLLDWFLAMYVMGDPANQRTPSGEVKKTTGLDESAYNWVQDVLKDMKQKGDEALVKEILSAVQYQGEDIQVTLKREALLSVLKAVKPGLSMKEVIEQSTSFVFMDGFVHTYNDAISIKAPVPELKGLTGAVNGQELYSLLSKMSSEEVTLTVTKGEFRIKAGRAKAGLRLIGTIVLPLDSIGGDRFWEPLPKNFSAGIKMALYSTAKTALTPSLTCIHIAGDVVESTDNVRLTRFQLSEELSGVDILLPSLAASEAAAFPITSFCLSDNGSWIHFQTSEGVEISCRLMVGKFPDLGSVLDVRGESVVLPKKLEEVLERAMVFCSEESKLDHEVEISLQGRQIMIKAVANLGWFEEGVGVRYEGNPVSFVVHPEFLQEACEVSADCMISKNRMKFRKDNWEHVIALKAS